MRGGARPPRDPADEVSAARVNSRSASVKEAVHPLLYPYWGVLRFGLLRRRRASWEPASDSSTAHTPPESENNLPNVLEPIAVVAGVMREPADRVSAAPASQEPPGDRRHADANKKNAV